MCGICGVLSLNGGAPDDAILSRMVETITHRGPDDSGIAISGPCGLGNTRLAVIDLSPAGHQPMYAAYTGPDGNSREAWIAYNGEAYNFHAVRAGLETVGHRFRSGTDTETLLHAYLEYGAEAFIHPFNGMFAAAIWDATHRKLILARDRVGKKPLFYALTNEWLIFGSEIKALLAHPALTPHLNGGVVPHYLAYGYPPAPFTLFEGIQSVPPGHLLIVDLEAAAPQIDLRSYWQPPFPGTGPDGVDEKAAAVELRERLRAAVRARMIADVPLGAFLSGGLDSAAIVALMAGESTLPVKTFSMGFSGEPSFDETAYARQIARQFATEHHEFIVKPDLIELVEELVWHHDQPFGDSSAIPTYMVSKLAREHVTVALTGDGGDELFAGYDRFRAARLADVYSRLIPGFAHRILVRALERARISTAYGGPVKRAARFVGAANLPLPTRYLSWVRYVPEGWVSALVGSEGEAAVQQHYAGHFAAHPQDDGAKILPRLLDVNFRTYLPDDLLVKVDRCSMAVSLEARSPFLDYELVEFAARLPDTLKLRRGTQKYLLKQAMRGILPDAIIDRPKHGFGVPVGRWFRVEMASYLGNMLLSKRAQGRGILNPAAVKDMIDVHMAGRADLGNALWTLLTFELWLRRYFD